jgi:hypothetical protein
MSSLLGKPDCWPRGFQKDSTTGNNFIKGLVADKRYRIE